MNKFQSEARIRNKFAVGMIIPTAIVLGLMTLYPMLFTAYYSLTDYNLLKHSNNFIGLQNYIELLGNEYFVKAIWVTVKFTVVTTIAEIFVGFLMSEFVNGLTRGQKIVRTVLLIPYLMPTVTVALSFRMMFSPNYGIVNYFLQMLGFPIYNWFSDINTAFKMLAFVDIWQNSPFVFLLIYASSQAIPKSQYEAAQIDGAGKLAQIWYITIPNLSTAIGLCTLLRVIDSFRLFEKVNLLTGGGPANSTTTITQYLYDYGIKSLKFGFTSAGAIIMTILVLFLSSIYIRRAVK